MRGRKPVGIDQHPTFTDWVKLLIQQIAIQISISAIFVSTYNATNDHHV